MTATNHHWCRDPSRDEAARASEDNRQGPLPTLEEAIAAPFAKTARICETEPAVDPVIPAADANGGGVVGLRTERVTLKVKHACKYPAAEWVLEEVQEACCDPGESVRVVDEVALEPGWAERLTADRDAAIREREEWRAECERLRGKIDALEGQSRMDIEREIAVEEAWESCDIPPHWPDDEPGTSHRYAESMRQEIVGLRDRVAELERDVEQERAEADRVVAEATAKLRAIEEKLESAPAASVAAKGGEWE